MRLLSVALAALLAVLMLGARVCDAQAMGIDLGSQFTKAATVKAGQAFQIVINAHSKRKTPSMITFEPTGERFFGYDAEGLRGRRPESTVQVPLQLLGRPHTHPAANSSETRGALPADFGLRADESRGTSLLSFGSGDAHREVSVEELTAMLLRHTRHNAERAIETTVRDCVIAVPSYFAQSERSALLDAAKLAGLKPLSLVEDNTAALTQYAIDRTFNGTQRVLLVNVGAASTQATVAAFSTREATVLGQKRPVSHVEILAKAWDEAAGGAFIDAAIASELADRFNAARRSSSKPVPASYDVRSSARAMAKLIKAAERLKEILSANENMPVVVEALHDDVDLRTSMSREQMERIVKPVLDRIAAPVRKVLDASGVQPAELHDVEIIGGGVRVPKVQSLLLDMLQRRTLSVHLNGDESVALGATFVAANLSTSFRVRPVGLIDITPHAVGLRIADLEAPEADASAAAASGEDEQQPESDAADAPPSSTGKRKLWSKRTMLFPSQSKMNSRKVVSFTHNRDMLARLMYEDSDESIAPIGSMQLLAAFNVSGVSAFAKQYAHLGKPKVSLTFQLDRSGIYDLVKAEATLTELVPIVENGTADANATADASAAPVASDADTQQQQQQQQQQQAADDGAASDAGDDAASSKSEDAAATKAGSATGTKTRKRTIKRSMVVSPMHSLLSVRPMDEKAFELSTKALRVFDLADQRRFERDQARNDLESIVLETRSYVGEDASESVVLATTQEQRSALVEEMMEVEDWLYGDGSDASVADLRSRYSSIKQRTDAIKFRVSEAEERPAAVELARAFITATRATLEQMAVDRPWVPEEDRAGVSQQLDALESWVNENVEKQAATPATDEPVFTAAELKGKLVAPAAALEKLRKIPKPKKVQQQAEAAAAESATGPAPSESQTESQTESPQQQESEVGDQEQDVENKDEL